MSKKLQCQQCGKAEYGEDLYNYDGEILCRYCIVARVYEGSTPCEYVGTCNDKTYQNKTEQIDQLKQQLVEKQNTIDEINKEFVQAVHDWKTLCAEKDEEIERLKQQYTILENENGKLTTELIMDKYKKAQKEVSFGKQLAIQELAEVERLLYESHYKEIDNKYYAELEDIENVIDSRIKALEELKGEKDEV